MAELFPMLQPATTGANFTTSTVDVIQPHNDLLTVAWAKVKRTVKARLLGWLWKTRKSTRVANKFKLTQCPGTCSCAGHLPLAGHLLLRRAPFGCAQGKPAVRTRAR